MLIKWQYLYSLLLYWNLLSPETDCYDILNKVTPYRFQAQIHLNREEWFTFHVSGSSVPTEHVLPCKDRCAARFAPTASPRDSFSLTTKASFGWGQWWAVGRVAIQKFCVAAVALAMKRWLGPSPPSPTVPLGFGPHDIAHTFFTTKKPQCMVTSHFVLSLSKPNCSYSQKEE